MTKEEFITKSKEIYNNKYDYRCITEEHLEPFNNVPICCDKHGLFFQSVYDHLQGKGCFDCETDKREK